MPGTQQYFSTGSVTSTGVVTFSIGFVAHHWRVTNLSTGTNLYCDFSGYGTPTVASFPLGGGGYFESYYAPTDTIKLASTSTAGISVSVLGLQ